MFPFSTKILAVMIAVVFGSDLLFAGNPRSYQGSGIPEDVRSLVAAPDLTLDLWPDKVPGGIPEGIKAEEWTPGKEPHPIVRVANVARPTLAFYKAKKPNGTVVVIFPGGGYNILAYNHEGSEIAQWFNTLGISAAVVKYRIPRREGLAKHAAPLQDAQRAIRIVRAHAKEWGIDPEKLGVLGFSAGGHLTVMAATQYNAKTYDPVDDCDQISCRPNFAIPIYPAYMMDDENEKKSSVDLSNEVVIDSKTPPMFISVADRDKNRAAAAARLFVKLYEAGVPAEIHIINGNLHGYGLRKDRGRPAFWDQNCEHWLKETGFLKSL
ncbi:MAG: alpha/beta hydrolase [Planctomycetia bacterium]|nr:alpha/beta hydrolase [Planctomycetia bacterium]